MELLVTYDVETTTPEGQRRLRKVAKICEGFGARVQKSVFEIVCEPAQRLKLEANLLATIDPKVDSIRIYTVPHGTFAQAQHQGAAVKPAHRGPLVL
jgi:CRISPR-associated protein Cas2